MKFTFRILVIAIFFLYIGGCAETQKQYKKYEPDEEFLATKIKTLQVLYRDCFVSIQYRGLPGGHLFRIFQKDSPFR